MSRLQELIQALCPDGVEYKRLNCFCEVYDGTHQTPQYTESGIKFVSVENINNLYATRKYISEEDYKKFKVVPIINDVIMTRIGSIGVCTVVDSNEPLAFYVSLALLRPDNDVVNSRYLKYVIESRCGRKELYKRTLVNAVPIKINTGEIGKIVLPVPPLEVQQEIVRILDNFTALTAELQAELQARKKQYEYYRNELLSFDDSVPKTLFTDVAVSISSGKNKIRLDDGMYPVYGSTGTISRTNTAVYDWKQILIARVGANAGFVHLADGQYDVSDNTLIVDVKEDYSLKYVYYLLQNMNLNQYAKGGGQPLITAGDVKKLSVQIPTRDVQETIVSILDRFDTLCNDLTTGLPAEIAARQAQYEYYRDKLLSFPQAR